MILSALVSPPEQVIRAGSWQKKYIQTDSKYHEKGFTKMKTKAIFIFIVFTTLNSGFATAQPAPPDYSDLKYWAASPHKADASDKIPLFLKDEKQDYRADVFFIYPTIYDNDSDTASWNAWLSDEKVNAEIDKTTILLQTSVFNGSCRVYSPRYRQANMVAFYSMGTPKADAAFDMAYNDVKTAFQYYLKNENNGRPIVIAGHSQGTLHAIRLLKEFFDGTSLQKQLVCAYIPGYRIKTDEYKSLPVGERPDQTGCILGWRSYIKGEIPNRAAGGNGNSVCVNPVTWTISEDWSPRELHQGIMLGFEDIIPNTVSAAIEPDSKILWVDIPPQIRESLEKKTDLHIYDINLFWMNIRGNVKLRIDSWLKENGFQK